MNVSTLKNITKSNTFDRKKYWLLVLSWLMLCMSSHAQTYELPDSNFRKKLQLSYPFLLSGNLLNLAAANAMTGTLDLSNASITNADGIQHFATITSLNLNFNQLETVPQLSALPQLERIFISHNKLISLPPLTGFGNLLDFQVPYNKLTTLPSFATNTKLLNIYCQNNLLTALPDISMLTDLRILDIGENNFGLLPDFSPLTHLEELHIHRTGIDTIRGLPALTSLTKLYAWGNRLRDLSDLNSNTGLILFQVFDNDLHTFPIVSNKPSLTNFSVIRNHLTVKNLLPLSLHSNFSNFDYHPQKPLPLTSLTVREKNSVVFDLNIDQDIPDSEYRWYKDGHLLASTPSNTYTIPAAAYADTGRYYVQVVHTGLPGLVLVSDTATLVVEACMQLIHATPEIVAEDCQHGTTLQIEGIELQGGTAPFEYRLLNRHTGATIASPTPLFESVRPGTYTFLVKDAQACQSQYNLSVYPPENCEAVFSPNGDGIADTYYIAEQGIARIYDISRTLIRQLVVPAEWDGRKSDGTPADDGYYAIVIDEKKLLHVTLVK